MRPALDVIFKIPIVIRPAKAMPSRTISDSIGQSQYGQFISFFFWLYALKDRLHVEQVNVNRFFFWNFLKNASSRVILLLWNTPFSSK